MGLVFINGKAIHNKESKNIRESFVLKIYDNQIIDEYRVYNGVLFKKTDLKKIKN